MCQQTAEEVKSEGSSAASPTPGSTSECFQVHTNNNASPQSRISVPGAMLVPLLSANVFAMNERKAVGKIYAFFCFDKSIEQKYDYYLLAVFGLKKGSLSSSFAESELLRIFREKHEDLGK